MSGVILIVRLMFFFFLLADFQVTEKKISREKIGIFFKFIPNIFTGAKDGGIRFSFVINASVQRRTHFRWFE